MRRLSVVACAWLLCAACSEPPQKEIDRAQGALDAARAAGADTYAAQELKAATDALQQSHDAVAQRDYRLALSRALDANERALEAAKQAADGKARARSEAEGALAAATAGLKQLHTRLAAATAARVPPKELQSARRAEVTVQAALQEARAAIKNGDYLVGKERLNGVTEQVSAEIRGIDEAAAARTAKPVRRRR